MGKKTALFAFVDIVAVTVSGAQATGIGSTVMDPQGNNNSNKRCFQFLFHADPPKSRGS